MWSLGSWWVPLRSCWVELGIVEAPAAAAPLKADLKTRVAEAEARDAVDQSRLRLPSDADYWVRIPAGEYPFGEEGKRVKLASFEIGRYPATVWSTGNI